ncbi:Eukaryotic translation initiation factor 2A [Datura stramonium]|uniref:Eukaryotic translation initiation factor 2A n=1 Tax=Datura stramonium TaxID=4076 RepID=A0ABS8SCY1_DATST|nr:Eukaryotic translation initiation factor 2A [Datura stramonium]
MTPQPLKIRAVIEMKRFQFVGVLHIKEAMRKAEAAGNDDCPVKIKLVAPPAYVLNTQTLDKEQGIAILTKAIAACTEERKLAVKEAPRAVSYLFLLNYECLFISITIVECSSFYL